MFSVVIPQKWHIEQAEKALTVGCDVSVVTFENHWVLWWQRLNLTSRWWHCFFYLYFVLWLTWSHRWRLKGRVGVCQSSILLRKVRNWEMWPRSVCFYNKSCSNSPNTNEKSFNASFPLEVFVQWLPDSNCFISWTTHLFHSILVRQQRSFCHWQIQPQL